MDIKKKLYLDVSTELMDIEGVQWVDWQKGQFRSKTLRTNLPLAAVLVDISKIRWKKGILGQREGLLALNIEVYGSCAGESQAHSPTKTEALAFLDLLTRITQHVQDFSMEGLQGFSCVEEQRLHLADMPHLIAYALAFQSRVCQVHGPNFIKYKPKHYEQNESISN